MTQTLTDGFCWLEDQPQSEQTLTDEQRYARLASWARRARGRNPMALDALSAWARQDAAWGRDRLAGNRQLLMQGVIARFADQNARLRAELQALGESVVNPAVFPALDRFDQELSGRTAAPHLAEPVARMFADFACMAEPALREQIAGGLTGPEGTDTVPLYGYLNYLKDCDAQVQWALFMPDLVRQQQQGFQVTRFDYRRMPAMRFVGRELGDGAGDAQRQALFETLDKLSGYASGLDGDALLMHHYGLGVDVGPWHGMWGRFLRADAPVPEGFAAIDFTPEDDGRSGPPYRSEFAWAEFAGDPETLHRREGYDSDAMYDVTRNIILGQGVNIPYPDKYWTCELFQDGWRRPGATYLFGVAL